MLNSPLTCPTFTKLHHLNQFPYQSISPPLVNPLPMQFSCCWRPLPTNQHITLPNLLGISKCYSISMWQTPPIHFYHYYPHRLASSGYQLGKWPQGRAHQSSLLMKAERTVLLNRGEDRAAGMGIIKLMTREGIQANWWLWVGKYNLSIINL